MKEEISTHDRSQLFTVRLWPADTEEKGSAWRGKVQHVTSGETHYFQKWPGLISLLETWLGQEADANS